MIFPDSSIDVSIEKKNPLKQGLKHRLDGAQKEKSIKTRIETFKRLSNASSICIEKKKSIKTRIETCNATITFSLFIPLKRKIH